MSAHTGSPSYGFETRQIHAGEINDAETTARVTPIYQTAGYRFSSFDDGEERFAGASSRRAYSRNDNPTNIVAAKRIADLEGGVDAVLVGSGQAAIAVTLFALAQTGDHILATTNLYEGTREMFRTSLARQGLSVEYVPADAPAEVWHSKVTERTRAIYTETIPNPLGDVVDIAALADIAHAAGVPLVVDSTVATPYLCRPIEWGADIVIHSTSKWLAGHGSVIGGAVIDGGTLDWAANGDRFPHLTTSPRPGVGSAVERFGAGAYLGFLRTVTILEYGPTVPPTSTFLLLQGIETLSLRMERHVDNALAVAREFEGHPALRQIHYPGLESSPYYPLTRKYLPQGAGSIVSFDLAGGRDAARVFIDALDLVTPMTHIGDVRSLAIHLGSTLHAKLTEEERLAVGITPGLVRLSIGIESAGDIIADLGHALDAVSAAGY